ncbi:hypothetical protein [Halorussus litoreus]|uniref:hypothetical protein n=1 Tax=Halorussus litoreus TaxID=1710536 RepID=UPI000E2428AA|nr:hypothetical protein [Halorussus litoreus]
MNRRRVLALCGLCLSGSAGCLSRLPGQPTNETDEPTEEPTETRTNASTGDPSNDETGETTTRERDESATKDGVTVENIVVRKAITYKSTMGSGGVLAGDGQQYVVASVRADRELSESDFSFVTDSDSWTPGLPETAGAINRSVAGRDGGPIGRRLGGGDGRSYLAFTVPSPLSASNPRIRLAGSDATEWPLDASQRERLEAPAPRFELDSLEVLDEIAQGETLSVSLTVTNGSETDGRFLAAVYWPTKQIADDDESHVVDRTVAAGDDVTASLDIDTRYTTYEDESVTLSVRGHVSTERTVSVEDATTPS